MTLLWLVLIPVAAWLAGNTAGWLLYGSQYGPWNWRALVGPWTYRRWVDRR